MGYYVILWDYKTTDYGRYYGHYYIIIVINMVLINITNLF